MATHFQKEIQLRFREADPAGIMFFGNVFALAHDCFEDFIQTAGFSWEEWFVHSKDQFLVPIRHTESNYLKPFEPGQKYQVTVSVARLGETSFQMKYVFAQGPRIHAEVRMTHVFMDARSKTKIPVPTSIRERLKVYVDANS